MQQIVFYQLPFVNVNKWISLPLYFRHNNHDQRSLAKLIIFMKKFNAHFWAFEQMQRILELTCSFGWIFSLQGSTFCRHVITSNKFNRVHHAWFVTDLESLFPQLPPYSNCWQMESESLVNMSKMVWGSPKPTLRHLKTHVLHLPSFVILLEKHSSRDRKYLDVQSCTK